MRIVSNARVVALLVAVAALPSGCSRTPAPQVVAGKVALSSFPADITAVRVVRAAGVVVEAPLASDGSFSLAIPAGTAYRIELIGPAARQPVLIFPRQSGAIAATFDVRGGRAPFDLGMVRYVGDPRAQTYSYRSTETDTDAVECEDGIDPTTGALCVDDTDEEGVGCEADGDNVECEDGIDPNTGAPCEGGPAANPTDDSADTAETADSETAERSPTSSTAIPTRRELAKPRLFSAGCSSRMVTWPARSAG